MDTLIVATTIVAQLFFYLLILAYVWFCSPRRRQNRTDLKLKRDVVMIKRLRTPSEKINAWFASAEFRLPPEQDIEIGFPSLSGPHVENQDTPRLTGSGTLSRPVIAPDDVIARPNEIQIDSGSPSSPDRSIRSIASHPTSGSDS